MIHVARIPHRLSDVLPAPNTKRFPPCSRNSPSASKIIAVVAFLLVAMTGMGLLAVSNMRAINANTVDITTSWLPSVRVLGDLRAGVITYRNVIREHMLSETLEEKLAMEKTLATVIEGNTQDPRRLRADDHLAGRARALQANGSKLWDRYKKGTEEVMALSRKAAGRFPTRPMN